MHHRRSTMLTAAALLVLAPMDADAQRRGGDRDRDRDRSRQEEEHDVAWTFTVRGSALDVGNLVEQRFDGGERELKGAWSAGVGASLGYAAWDKTRIQASFLWSPLTLEYTDDTPGGSGARGQRDVAELETMVLSLEVLHYFFDEESTFAPYGIGGVAGALWRLEDGSAAVAATGDDALARIGVAGGLGAEIRFTDDVSLNIEFSTYSVGSPFDGDDAFRLTSGETFDERDKASLEELSVGITWTAGR